MGRRQTRSKITLHTGSLLSCSPTANSSPTSSCSSRISRGLDRPTATAPHQPTGRRRASKPLQTNAEVGKRHPSPEETARLIWKQRDEPLVIEGMSQEGRLNFPGAVEDATWNIGFNESQMGWAALIANGKPPSMDVGSEPSPHSQYTRENEVNHI